MPIVGESNYEKLDEVQLQLNTNVASILPNLENKRLGILYLTITAAVYNMQSATPFVPPENPGSDPPVPAGSTGPHIVDIK